MGKRTSSVSRREAEGLAALGTWHTVWVLLRPCAGRVVVRRGVAPRIIIIGGKSEGLLTCVAQELSSRLA
jgi:hypothetical protein